MTTIRKNNYIIYLIFLKRKYIYNCSHFCSWGRTMIIICLTSQTNIFIIFGPHSYFSPSLFRLSSSSLVFSQSVALILITESDTRTKFLSTFFFFSFNSVKAIHTYGSYGGIGRAPRSTRNSSIPEQSVVTWCYYSYSMHFAQQVLQFSCRILVAGYIMFF